MIRLLAAAALALAAAAPAGAQKGPADSGAAFLADLEKVKAHFLASQELYAAGQSGPAGVHASHPVQEIGERVVRPIRQGAGAEAAERARALLRQPGRALEPKPSADGYRDTVAQVTAGLDDLANRTLSARVRDALAFRARVVALLVESLVEEYEQAVKAGAITQVIEYQDAWAFLQRARARYRDIGDRIAARAPATARALDADLTALAGAFPAVIPPATPLPVAEVRALTRRISQSLRTLRD
jgi:hypothetical protein